MEERRLFSMVFCSLLFQITMAKDCENGPIPDQRVFLVKFEGGKSLPANSTMFSRNLGSCRTVDDHVDKMIDHFKSWGVDLSSRRGNAFEAIDNETLRFRPLATDPNARFRVTAESFFDYAQITNSRILAARWSLLAKKEFSGPRGTINQNHHIQYGFYRIEKENQDLCLEYYSRIPHTLGSLRHVDLVVKHATMGEGTARGLVVIDGPSGYDVDIDYIMIFPGNPM